MNENNQGLKILFSVTPDLDGEFEKPTLRVYELCQDFVNQANIPGNVQTQPITPKQVESVINVMRDEFGCSVTSVSPEFAEPSFRPDLQILESDSFRKSLIEGIDHQIVFDVLEKDPWALD